MKYCLPNDMSPEVFLAEYWQKKPFLIKGGLPNLIDMFEPEDILGLALDEQATARLITQHISQNNDKSCEQWKVLKSPLPEDSFDNLPLHWTVLVQNLEQWSPELGQLWDAFGFIPQWQRDDIMVSFASKGGSVGKHYDDYDVFLAQGYGHRHWQLGQYCGENTAFVENQPIRLLDNIGEVIFDEVLAPGDVLYVPPKLSHYGVAQDDCLTFSFGFRRPNLMQVLDSLADIATSEHALFTPLLLQQSIQSSGRLEKSSIDQIKSQLLAMLQSDQGDKLLAQAVSEVVSKRQYDALIPEEPLNATKLKEALLEGAKICPDYNSRLIYTQFDDVISVFANGQPLDNLSLFETSLLQRLANAECLTVEDILLTGNVQSLDTPLSSMPNTTSISNSSSLSNQSHRSSLNNMADHVTVLTIIRGWLENGWVWLDY